MSVRTIIAVASIAGYFIAAHYGLFAPGQDDGPIPSVARSVLVGAGLGVLYAALGLLALVKLPPVLAKFGVPERSLVTFTLTVWSILAAYGFSTWLARHLV